MPDEYIDTFTVFSTLSPKLVILKNWKYWWKLASCAEKSFRLGFITKEATVEAAVCVNRTVNRVLRVIDFPFLLANLGSRYIFYYFLDGRPLGPFFLLTRLCC